MPRKTPVSPASLSGTNRIRHLGLWLGLWLAASSSRMLADSTASSIAAPTGPAVAATAGISNAPVPAPGIVPPAVTPRPAEPKEIFAHFMGCWPIASGPTVYDFQGAQQLPEHTSGDETARIGGHVRNWPLITPGVKLSLHDSCDLEIRRAMHIGIDGFTIDAWAGGQSARDTLDMMFQVAEEKHYPFQLTITPDPNSLNGASAVDAIKYLLDKHGSSPNLARRDGKPLIFGYQSVFVALGNNGQFYTDHPEWKGKLVWNQSVMRSTDEGWIYMGKAMKDLDRLVGQPLYLEFCLSAMDFGAPGGMSQDQLVQAAGDIAPYVGAVGGFNWVPKEPEISATVIAHGAEWMIPVTNGQKENLPWESYGAEGFDWMFWAGQALSTNSTLIQFITWNDYGENSNIAPGYNTRYGLYELAGYNIRWWKEGKRPDPDHDRIFIGYQKYPNGAKIFPFHAKFGRKHVLEVLSMLTAPATIKLPGRCDGYEAPAGLYEKKFPNAPGEVDLQLIRNGVTVMTLHSPEPITDKPFREDDGIVVCSSEDERDWKADFGDTPMWSYSEYGDADHNGLPNWFEMYWTGHWLDFTRETGLDPSADPHNSGKTYLQNYLDQTNPNIQSVPAGP